MLVCSLVAINNRIQSNEKSTLKAYLGKIKEVFGNSHKNKNDFFFTALCKNEKANIFAVL